MQLEPNEIHVWSTTLTITTDEEKEKFTVLSQDECERADRFHFPIHRKRFIAARSMLRHILGLYLNALPEDIVFAYTEHEKPYLSTPNNTQLQFNLAHSHDIAVYAFTLNQAIGVDIEKVKASYDDAVAKRFFSPKENAELVQLSRDAQIDGFYRIWSRKEALIKATGKGLIIPLSSFSVSASDISEVITLEDENWSLIPLSIEAGYQSALASNQNIKKVLYWQLFDQTPKLDKVSVM